MSDHNPGTVASDVTKNHTSSITVIQNGYRMRQTIRGRPYEWTMSKKCDTCLLPHDVILRLHAKALSGITVAQATRELEGEDLEGASLPSYGSVKSHLNGHFSGTRAGKLIDSHLASAMAMTISEMESNPLYRVDPEASARMVLANASAMLAQGQLELKASDLLNAAKLVREIEQEDRDVDEAMFFAQAMSIVMAEAQASMRSQDFDALIWRLQTNPVMQDIIRQVSGRSEEQTPLPRVTESIEAESVEADPMSVIA